MCACGRIKQRETPKINTAQKSSNTGAQKALTNQGISQHNRQIDLQRSLSFREQKMYR